MRLLNSPGSHHWQLASPTTLLRLGAGSDEGLTIEQTTDFAPQEGCASGHAPGNRTFSPAASEFGIGLRAFLSGAVAAASLATARFSVN